jgi:reductive dehalogenase
MAVYHGTTSKNVIRKLLSKIGLGKARDLDEVAASPLAQWKRPWWVKTVDKPTVDIDWDVVERFDETRIQQRSFPKYVGEEENKKLRKQQVERTRQWVQENKPNYTLRDRALDIAVRQGAVGTSFLGFAQDPKHVKDGWGGNLMTPEKMGVPPWQGTPEDNAAMMRAALIMFGASQVSFLELDDYNRKFIYSVDNDGKRLDFEDVDQAYEEETRRVIPNKARWVIVFTVQMSEELLKRRLGRAPTPFSAAATGSAYARARVIFDDTQLFLHCLGYYGLMSYWFNGLGIADAFAVMSGIGELSRLNRVITPEYGPMVRIFRLITNLPLAPTKPISAGIMRFCKTCKKCATLCPSGTLSLDTEPSWEVKGPWSAPGHKTWYEDSTKCMAYWIKATSSCSTCFSVCPFSKKNKSFMHHFVESTISRTTLFNSLFTKMDGLLDYDIPKDPESWWYLNMPPYGIDGLEGTKLE